MSSPASLPKEIHWSAQRGELQKVVKWLRKGGAVDAHRSATTHGGRPTTITLLQTAALNDHLEMVRELLKRGASVDLQNSLGYTALIDAACWGHLSVVLVLLKHSANPDLQDIDGVTALMEAAGDGHGACVKALLRAGAPVDQTTIDGSTPLMAALLGGVVIAVVFVLDVLARLRPTDVRVVLRFGRRALLVVFLRVGPPRANLFLPALQLTVHVAHHRIRRLRSSRRAHGRRPERVLTPRLGRRLPPAGRILHLRQRVLQTALRDLSLIHI